MEQYWATKINEQWKPQKDMEELKVNIAASKKEVYKDYNTIWFQLHDILEKTKL